MEVLEHLVGVDEEHVKPLPTRFMGEGLGEVAFSATIQMPRSE